MEPVYVLYVHGKVYCYKEILFMLLIQIFYLSQFSGRKESIYESKHFPVSVGKTPGSVVEVARRSEYTTGSISLGSPSPLPSPISSFVPIGEQSLAAGKTINSTKYTVGTLSPSGGSGEQAMVGEMSPLENSMNMMASGLQMSPISRKQIFNPLHEEGDISTANRRRWAHLFHKSGGNVTASGLYMTAEHWKSLTFPASLPLTTDYQPFPSTLASLYDRFTYTVPVKKASEDSIFRGRTDMLLAEMLLQRIGQGYQLILSDKERANEVLGTLERLFEEEWNPASRDGNMPSSKGGSGGTISASNGGNGETGSGTEGARGSGSVGHSSQSGQEVRTSGGAAQALPAESIGNGGIVGQGVAGSVGEPASDGSNGRSSSQSDLARSVHSFELSLGHNYHELRWEEGSKEVEVVWYRRKRLKSEQSSHSYSYLLWPHGLDEFGHTNMLLAHEPPSLLNWHYFDEIVSGYQTQFLRGNFKYWRLRLSIPPTYRYGREYEEEKTNNGSVSPSGTNPPATSTVAASKGNAKEDMTASKMGKDAGVSRDNSGEGIDRKPEGSLSSLPQEKVLPIMSVCVPDFESLEKATCSIAEGEAHPPPPPARAIENFKLFMKDLFKDAETLDIQNPQHSEKDLESSALKVFDLSQTAAGDGLRVDDELVDLDVIDDDGDSDNEGDNMDPPLSSPGNYSSGEVGSDVADVERSFYLLQLEELVNYLRKPGGLKVKAHMKRLTIHRMSFQAHRLVDFILEKREVVSIVCQALVMFFLLKDDPQLKTCALCMQMKPSLSVVIDLYQNIQDSSPQSYERTGDSQGLSLSGNSIGSSSELAAKIGLSGSDSSPGIRDERIYGALEGTGGAGSGVPGSSFVGERGEEGLTVSGRRQIYPHGDDGSGEGGMFGFGEAGETRSIGSLSADHSLNAKVMYSSLSESPVKAVRSVADVNMQLASSLNSGDKLSYSEPLTITKAMGEAGRQQEKSRLGKEMPAERDEEFETSSSEGPPLMNSFVSGSTTRQVLKVAEAKRPMPRGGDDRESTQQPSSIRAGHRHITATRLQAVLKDREKVVHICQLLLDFAFIVPARDRSSSAGNISARHVFRDDKELYRFSGDEKVAEEGFAVQLFRNSLEGTSRKEITLSSLTSAPLGHTPDLSSGALKEKDPSKKMELQEGGDDPVGYEILYRSKRAARISLPGRPANWLLLEYGSAWSLHHWYDVEVQWMVSAGSSVRAFVAMLVKKAKTHGLSISQVPCTRTLAQEEGSPWTLPVELEVDGGKDMKRIHMALLRKFGFVVDMGNCRFSPPHHASINKAGHMAYIHTTGIVIVCVQERRLFW